MMVYKKKNLKKVFLKSLIVGITVLILDGLAHFTIWNPETFLYFLAKPVVSGYVAFLAFRYSLNIFKLKQDSFTFYIYYSVFFALLHGIYYRVVELLTSQPLFTRIGDLHLGFITLEASTSFMGILIGALNGLLIHGGSFLIGIYLAKLIVKK